MRRRSRTVNENAGKWDDKKGVKRQAKKKALCIQSDNVFLCAKDALEPTRKKRGERNCLNGCGTENDGNYIVFYAVSKIFVNSLIFPVENV